MKTEWSRQHPLYRDKLYHPHILFRDRNVWCRIEKLGCWPFGHVYRVVFYTYDGSKYGFTKIRFSEKSALELKDAVFANRNSYGFK